jgi:hypothetical protein
VGYQNWPNPAPLEHSTGTINNFTQKGPNFQYKVLIKASCFQAHINRPENNLAPPEEKSICATRIAEVFVCPPSAPAFVPSVVALSLYESSTQQAIATNSDVPPYTRSTSGSGRQRGRSTRRNPAAVSAAVGASEPAVAQSDQRDSESSFTLRDTTQVHTVYGIRLCTVIGKRFSLLYCCVIHTAVYCPGHKSIQQIAHAHHSVIAVNGVSYLVVPYRHLAVHVFYLHNFEPVLIRITCCRMESASLSLIF